MRLDVRVPVGLMFATMGVLMAGYGLVGDRSIYARSLGINVNLWWGLVLLVFGITMLAFSLRSKRQGVPNSSRTDSTSTP